MSEYRKAIVAIVAFLVTTASVALEGHLIPESWLPYVVAGIGLAGSYGVYKATNVPSVPSPPPSLSSGTTFRAA